MASPSNLISHSSHHPFVRQFCFFVEVEIDFNAQSPGLLLSVQYALKTKRITMWTFLTSAISSSVGRKLLSNCLPRPSEIDLKNTSHTSQSYLSLYICLSLCYSTRSVWLTQALHTVLCREDILRYCVSSWLPLIVVPWYDPIPLWSMNCSNMDSIPPPFCNIPLPSISDRLN